jgi:NhaP-type Na+/H+ or K+/H+ antiporter
MPFYVDISDSSVPSFVIGAILGPFCTNLIDPSRWNGSDEQGEIAYVGGSYLVCGMLLTDQALTRMVIGIQMVKVGYELPKQYLRRRLVELTICLLPLMTVQWLATSSCILLMVPHLSFVRLSLYQNVQSLTST